MTILFRLALVAALLMPLRAWGGSEAPVEHLSDKCWDIAKTQEDMNFCASRDADEAGWRLRALYEQILREYASDKVFVEKMKAAQAAWAAYTVAQLRAIYPVANDRNSAQGYYGSVFPMCLALDSTVYIQDRIKELLKWTVGSPEGDVCVGSRAVSREPLADAEEDRPGRP